MTSIVKMAKNFGNIHGILIPEYQTQEERFTNISKWALAILKKFSVDCVCIEGYSMSSKSSSVFDIGENTGVLKHNLYLNDIHIDTVAPTQVKKFFTGKGNAKKDVMHQCFVEKTNFNVSEALSMKVDGNPVSDIVDSYAILQYARNNLFKQ